MTTERLAEIDSYLARRREQGESEVGDEFAAELLAEVRRLQAARLQDDRPIEPESVARVAIGLVDGSESLHEIPAGSSFTKIERAFPSPLQTGGICSISRVMLIRWTEPPREVTFDEYQKAVVAWRYEQC